MQGLSAHLLRLIPDNLVDMWVEEWETLAEIAVEQRFAVVWVPRGTVLRALLDAGTPEARAQTIRDSEAEILDDCAASLATVHHPDLAELVDFTKNALRLHRDGQVAGSQALATNVLETALEHHTPRRDELPCDVRKKSAKADDEDTIQRWVLVLTAAGIPTAYEHYDYQKRTAHYSRHGTVHAVNTAQYTQDNSLRAITLAASWLRYLSKYLFELKGRTGARTGLA